MATDLVLNLWKENLGIVPPEIWNNSKITALILDNALSAISPRIGEFQDLRTLDLGHNELAELPNELGTLVKLRDFLYLHDNQLDSLPQSLEGVWRRLFLRWSSRNRDNLEIDAGRSDSWLSVARSSTKPSTCLQFYLRAADG